MRSRAGAGVERRCGFVAIALNIKLMSFDLPAGKTRQQAPNVQTRATSRAGRHRPGPGSAIAARSGTVYSCGHRPIAAFPSPPRAGDHDAHTKLRDAAGQPRRQPRQRVRLANGLQVVVVPDHRAPVVTHYVWYRVGAADEPPGVSGIAHFLEHLMFKSTDKIASGDFSRIVSRLGGQDNAFTMPRRHGLLPAHLQGPPEDDHGDGSRPHGQPEARPRRRCRPSAT